MKAGRNDKKAQLRFTPEELDFLQDNAIDMAEAFGLDTRILNLKGKRAVGFYMWDLECLHEVSDMAKPKAPAEQIPMIEALLVKLNHAMEECR